MEILSGITVPDLGLMTTGLATDLVMMTRSGVGKRMEFSDFANYVIAVHEQAIASQTQTVVEALNELYLAVKGPATAISPSEMTDTSKIYVFIGNTGTHGGQEFTYGHWYYYTGSAWADGGVFNAVAVQTDTGLSVSGMAADAKATGDAINAHTATITEIQSTIDAIIAATSDDVGKVLSPTAVADGKVTAWEFIDAGADVDSTLTEEGKAADAKATGDAIAAAVAGQVSVDSTLTVQGDAADAKATGDAVADLSNAITLDDANARKIYSVTSVNLFDYSDCELGDYNSSGVPTSSTSAMRTKTPIQISGVHTISNYNMRRIFYDAGMNFISRSNSATDVDTPENAAFVRFSISKSIYDAHTDIMVNEGATLLSYQAFSVVPNVLDAALENTTIAEYVKNALKWAGVGINNSNLTTYVTDGDFDNLVDGLVYAVSVDSTSALNKPVADMVGTFLSLKYDRTSPNNVAQLFIGRDGMMCFRYRISNGTWTSWGTLDANRIKQMDDLFWLVQADKTSVNLFDYSDCELGNISSMGKDTDSDTGMRTKHLVPFSGAEIASSCNSRKVYYDAFGNFISRSESNSLDTVPDGAAYVRFVIATSDYEQTVMANVGESILPYQAFKLYTATDTKSSYYSELYKTFKRVGVIGDSLSVGYSGHTGTYSKIIERNLVYSWPKCIGRDADSYWLNFGEHGMNVLTWCSSETRGKVQMEAENNKCQCYIICLGVNDSTPTGSRHVDVGQASDIVDNPDTVATTYYGGYARIIQLVKRRNPDARIFCSTIPDEQRSTANRTRYKPYNDAVRYIAGTYYTADDNVFLLDMATDYGDLFNTPGAPLYIEQVGDNHVSHFSSVGYQMISKIYEEAISKVMLQNQPKFMDIMYIPCDTAEPTEDTMVGYEETDNT